MRSISFDLDGVLLDSEPLVRRAYARAGITLNDDAWRYAWGKSWAEWLPPLVGGCFEARTIHEAKNRAYARIIRDATIEATTAHTLAAELQKEDGFVVTTCASVFAANIVLERLGLNPLLVEAGLSLSEKIALISDRNLIHIDDDLVVVQSIRDGIHYTGQTVERLRDTVRELNPWMP